VTGKPRSTQKTFVLVHGAWHGGWCWLRVATLLEGSGHRVLTPTLTGLAERSHLLSRDINLDTHIADVVNVFKWQDLEDVCLVVHSYGGFPGSGAVEQIGQCISSVVWLDAAKPHNGWSVLNVLPQEARQAFLDADEKRQSAMPAPPAEAFLVNDKDQAWVNSKLTPQPLLSYLQPIKLGGALNRVPRKTYIRATKLAFPAFDQAMTECKAEGSWRVLETTVAGHDVMIDAPEWLADTLLQVS